MVSWIVWEKCSFWYKIHLPSNKRCKVGLLIKKTSFWKCMYEVQTLLGHDTGTTVNVEMSNLFECFKVFIDCWSIQYMYIYPYLELLAGILDSSQSPLLSNIHWSEVITILPSWLVSYFLLHRWCVIAY